MYKYMIYIIYISSIWRGPLCASLARNPLGAWGSDQPDNILTFPNAATVRAPNPQFLGKLGQSGHYEGAKKDG